MNCLFCDLLSGKKKNHINGLPFKILKETKYSISFQAISIPKITKINILVIPKEHYHSIESVPDKIMLDLLNHIKLVIKKLKKKYPGVNLLLNEGKDANQVIPHVHFHIYAREKGDGFFDGFNEKMIREDNKEEFEKDYKRLKKLIEKE